MKIKCLERIYFLEIFKIWKCVWKRRKINTVSKIVLYNFFFFFTIIGKNALREWQLNKLIKEYTTYIVFIG